MGIFSKLWKGVKKTFKKIFKPIKKVFKSVGKFMNKIGIVGQIAMMFIPIPGLGALMSGLGSMGKQALGWLAGKGAVGAAAANVIGSAAKFVGAVAKPFVDITKGVTGFVKDVTKFVVNKIPGVNISAPSSIFGKGGAWQTASETITNSFKGFGGNIASAASMDISDLLAPKGATAAGYSKKIMEDFNYSGNKASDYSSEIMENFNAPEPDFKLGDDYYTGAVDAPSLGDSLEIPSSNTPAYAESASKALDMREASQAYRDTIARDQAMKKVGAGVVQETIKEGTEGFFNKMKNSILDPYKKFTADPLGVAGEYASDYVSDALSPQGIYNMLNKPEMPEYKKEFQGMYISPILESSKYDAITAQQSQYPAFMQQGLDMGLFQGGYDPLPEGFMGWGGSEYNRTMAQFAPQS